MIRGSRRLLTERSAPLDIKRASGGGVKADGKGNSSPAGMEGGALLLGEDDRDAAPAVVVPVRGASGHGDVAAEAHDVVADRDVLEVHGQGERVLRVRGDAELLDPIQVRVDQRAAGGR